MLTVYPNEPMFRIAKNSTTKAQVSYYLAGFPVERIISIAANP